MTPQGAFRSTALLAGLILMSSTVRLFGGSTPFSGRIETLREGSWVAFGAEQGHGAVDRAMAAAVACRSLGFVGDTAPVVEASTAFGPARPGPWMMYTDCTGDESSLMDCHCWNYGYGGSTCATVVLQGPNCTDPLAITCPSTKCESVSAWPYSQPWSAWQRHQQ